MKTLFPALQRLALTTAVVLTPFWLSGCATNAAGVNVPGLQQILEAGVTTSGYGNKIAVHEVLRTQNSAVFTKATQNNVRRPLANVGLTYAQNENYFLENYFWGGILINDSLWTNLVIEFLQGPDDKIRTVRSGDLVLMDTQRMDLF